MVSSRKSRTLLPLPPGTKDDDDYFVRFIVGGLSENIIKLATRQNVQPYEYTGTYWAVAFDRLDSKTLFFVNSY